MASRGRGSLKKADGLRQVTVQIAGVQRLLLRAVGTADWRTRVQAVWVDPTLTR